MKCRLNDCSFYEPSAKPIEGYCDVYDLHVGHGDDCPMNEEYDEGILPENTKLSIMERIYKVIDDYDIRGALREELLEIAAMDTTSRCIRGTLARTR